MPRNVTMIPLVCAHCGQKKMIPYSRRHQRYCSNTCKIEARKKPKDWACIDCGTRLSAPHVKRCVPCNARAQIGTISPKRVPDLERHPDDVRLIKRICTVCGKECWQNINYHKRPTAYCSAECRRIWASQRFNKQVGCTCLTCGKAFQMPKCRIDRGGGRFCSFVCYRRYTGETLPETNVRKSLTLLGIAFDQEHKFGRFRIDFFLPLLRTALEVDAEYWHEPDAEKDRRRDAWMNANGVRVIRVSAGDFIRRDISEMAECIARLLFSNAEPEANAA